MKLRSFFEKLFDNWPVKLLSFGLAVLLYAAFQITSLDSKSFSVPLQMRAGGNFTATEAPPNSVRITVKGKTEEIAAIQETDIRAYIDTSVVIQPGATELPVKLNLSSNLALIDPFDVEIKPHSIKLTFDENGFAWIPVEPVFKGVIPYGYEMSSWQCTPSDIKIAGMKSIVDSITVAFADGVDLNERTEPFTTTAVLELGNNNIRALAENTVSVYVEIVPQIVNRVYEDITPQTFLLSPEFLLVQPLPLVSLELSGEKILLDDYNLRANALLVDFSGITEVGEYTISLRTNVPNEFEVISISITEVVVHIVPNISDVQDIDDIEDIADTENASTGFITKSGNSRR